MAQYIAEVTKTEGYSLSYKFKDSEEVFVVATLTLLDLVKDRYIGMECCLEIERREGTDTLLSIHLSDRQEWHLEQQRLIAEEFSSRDGT